MPIRGVIGTTCTAAVVAGVTAAGLLGVDVGSWPAALAVDAKASSNEVVAVAAHPHGRGVYLLSAAGRLVTRGDAVPRGDLAGRGVQAPAVDLVPTPDGGGYWIFDAGGGVHSFGSAPYLGSLNDARARGETPGTARVISAAATPSGRGYLTLDEQGGIFTFGDARYLGSVPGLRAAGVPVGAAPAVDLTVTAGGNGYLVLDEQGGIFTFGDASFFGSIPALRAAGVTIGRASVRDIVAATDGRGYWVTDSVGGIFAFGDVTYAGSAPEIGAAFSLVSTAVLPDGSGYWMADPGGRLLAFGTAAGAGPRPAPAPVHRFIETMADGSPVRFNPCRTLEYVVQAGPGSPANAHDLVAQALGRVSQATGVRFASRGATSETFRKAMDRPRWNHPAYGGGPTPILVSFEPPSNVNGLDRGDAGMAGRLPSMNAAGQKVTVTAAAVVNTSIGLTPDFRDGASYGAVLLHELGHTMGLDHVDASGHIMSTVLRGGGPGTYQPGDLEGLAAVGTRSGCLAEPSDR